MRVAVATFGLLAVAAILCAHLVGLTPGQALALVGMAGGFVLAGAIVAAETERKRLADVGEAYGDIAAVPPEARR